MPDVVREIESVPGMGDEALLRLSDSEMAVLKRRHPTKPELEELFAHPAMRLFFALIKREGNQAMTKMTMGAPAATEVIRDPTSWHQGVAFGLRSVLSLRKEMYEKAKALTEQPREREKPEPEEDLFGDGVPAVVGDSNESE
jgi:hypothetical protein